MKKTDIIVNTIAYLYALLFLYTGLSKLIDQASFKQTLYKSLLFHSFTDLLAIAIPSLEILIALLIILPYSKPTSWQRKWGLNAGIILMALFTLYVGFMLLFQKGKLPCSCGGIIQKMNWHQHFYFNSFFTLAGIAAIWLNGRKGEVHESRLAVS